MTSVMNAALTAAERGWPVFPLHPGSKRPTGHAADRCPGTGRCARGHLVPEQRATTDPDLIRAAWTQWQYNVGIATGPAGLLVVDLDVPKPNSRSDAPCGATTFQALCERAGQAVPRTLTVRTASGGRHLYFTAPAGARIGNSAGRLGKLIDTRGWGGYVVAPGSTTPAGTYEVTDPAPVAPLPAWLHTALTAPQAAPAVPSVTVAVRSGSRYANAVLDRETTAVANTSEGGRNETLLRSVIRTGRFVAWGDLDRAAVEEAFQAAGESAGLTSSECRTTIRSALAYSLRTARPRETA
ncbi:bifunctional DNA primase/polymerase [Streptomyces odontomachi]|uniref:bifunctional DNA primase/polymerase n=1 Tax=Streptomyces odontomachi TaxID=2944940 RepID=UPI00210A7626|nr:bifunctional DNA primase/polymerase [Streptomyces sp. ODS25]